jgi:hypothetical protein
MRRLRTIHGSECRLSGFGPMQLKLRTKLGRLVVLQDWASAKIAPWVYKIESGIGMPSVKKRKRRIVLGRDFNSL